MPEELQMFPRETSILRECQPEVRLDFLLYTHADRPNSFSVHRINVKLGGINLIPDPASVSALTDPHTPTIVMGNRGPYPPKHFALTHLHCLLGADVIHPAPGSDGRPSFTALVANVDSDTAKYIAGN